MKHISLNPILKSWLALPAAALVAIAMSAALTGVHAQNAADDETLPVTTPLPYAEVQYATLTGTTNTINLSQLPVVDSTGALHYVNVTIPLEESVSSKGVVTVTTGTPTVVAAPTPLVSSFKAGPYAGPGGASAAYSQLLTLSGLGVAGGGATEWSVSTTSGATGCTYPTTATFYVGPLASNPLYSRLKKAGIASTAYSYGIMGDQTCEGQGAGNGWWLNGAILGFTQTGNTLNISSFTYDGGDQATAGSTITYTYQ
jgi:hypothetical protein